jgi:Uma2 family endonuclease
MVISADPFSPAVEYPDEDGKPMAEGDIQRQYLSYSTEVLHLYFANRPDVYVAGNLFIYYEQGNPEAVVAPDTFVVFGVGSQNRRSYKTWENHDKTPSFALEITSKSTRSQDQGAKKGIYAFLEVPEYFQYDPTGDYLDPVLQGFQLIDGHYEPMASTLLADGSLSVHSQTLGLDLRVKDGQLRFYDPATNQKLLPYAELEQAFQEAEQARREAEQARIAAEERAIALEVRLAELESRLRSSDPNSEQS